MRRTLAVCALATITLAGCGGDDDDTVASTVATLPPTTTIDVPVDADRCEDTPDIADYPEGEAPTAVRPCDVPDVTVSQVIRAGSGPTSAVGDGVIYHATLIRSEDGELVDSSWSDGRPNNLPSVGTGGTITDLDENLVGVQVGEVLRLDIAAGDETGTTVPSDDLFVPPTEPLTYVIEVVGIIPQLSADDAPRNISVEPSVDAVEITTVDLVEGDGKVVEEGDVVVFAMLLARGDNEVILVNSWHQGTPAVVELDPARTTGAEMAALPGIVEGLQGARVGGRRVITMPPSEAWGDGGQPALGLPPDTDVIVVADVLAAY